jgi:DNA-directed RNA polymerase subunit RPC12/RpoP
MVEGYCVKCKKKVEIENGKQSKTSKGTAILKGKCPNCGTTVCRMLGKK